MKLKDVKKINIPDKPGVYFFLKDKSILYIGKATSLRDRVRSYFSADIIKTRGPMILDMTVQADTIDWQETDSVLEALILEAELIKKYQPKYNIKEKDDKSWNYVCITQPASTRGASSTRGGEEVPKVVIKRGKELNQQKNVFGPFTNGLQLREAMKIIRRIFPYIDGDSIKKNNQQFYKQLGLTPDSLKEYKDNIKNLKLFFQGKKKKIIQNFKKEMLSCAKKYQFEKAGEIKKKIFALEHINDIALIKDDFFEQKIERSYARIEAYDVAHMSGKNMVGVMTVLLSNVPAKNEYKKFIIKTQNRSNDTGALEEVLMRRFRHTEWGVPDLIVVDGSIAQINVAKRVLNFYQMKISIVAVTKDERHKAKEIKGEEKIIKKYKKEILLVNSEAHRFAINFYRQKSRKNMI